MTKERCRRTAIILVGLLLIKRTVGTAHVLIHWYGIADCDTQQQKLRKNHAHRNAGRVWQTRRSGGDRYLPKGKGQLYWSAYYHRQ